VVVVAADRRWASARDGIVARLVDAHRCAVDGQDFAEAERLARLRALVEAEPPIRRSRPKGMKLNWSRNAKLDRTCNAVSFCLPAFRSAGGFVVCRGAGAGCATWCYARQARYGWGHVAHPRAMNLAIVRASIADFIEMAVQDVERLRGPLVRVHDSGDFFSQEYLDAWLAIARHFVGRRIFYTFTKSLDLIWSSLPENFLVCQSAQGRFQDRIDWNEPVAWTFPTHDERVRAGFIDATQDDWPLLLGERRIGHVYHGLPRSSHLSAVRGSLKMLPLITTSINDWERST
jgi:hypothetical protein